MKMELSERVQVHHENHGNSENNATNATFKNIWKVNLLTN